ncbi:MAG: TfoX/Sxy family protein [Alphaproteobacteria bacterium]|nr:TfoX/Sxy family protein [Alphaproteobacteria bacterium]
MAWRKSPPTLIARFDAVLPKAPGVVRRSMFGYPVAFVNDAMFTGLHQESFILRLSDGDRRALAKAHDARPFEPLPGRVMREYLALPPALIDDAGELKAWVARGLAYARSVKRKPARSKNRKRAAKR